MTIFWNSYTRNFGKYLGKHMQFPYNETVWLQSTAYNWTKVSITDTFLSKDVLKFLSAQKGCSKILKIPKHFCKTVSSFLMLQACSLEFPDSTKQILRKMFPVSALKWLEIHWEKIVIDSFYQGNKITI